MSFFTANRTLSDKLKNCCCKFFHEPSYNSLLNESIYTCIHPRCQILEAGGIDRPLLEKSSEYEYIGLDIEHRDTCEQIYDRFIVQSVEDPLPSQYDLIISRTLLEHVPNNKKSFKSMAAALKPGGSMIHYIPCGFHPYSLATRLVGHRLQNILIRKLRPGAADVTGYKAYYNHCTPRGMKRLLTQNSLTEIQVIPFWGAGDYFKFFVPFYLLITCFNHLCRFLRLGIFASGMIVIAKKPMA